MCGDVIADGAAGYRERAWRDMRTAVIEAARQIMVEQGTDALTIRLIARRLGYSPGARYL